MSAATCPKRMRFGPCGGVRADGSCEVDDRPCPFLGPVHENVLGRATAAHGRTPVAVDLPEPAIVVDVRAPLRWVGDERRLWHAIAASIHGCVALLGEHVDNPAGTDDAGQVDPTVAIRELAAEGIPVVATVTGRDRDLAAARSTMLRLHEAGAVAIHCVTGDHPAALSIERTASFGGEAVSLAALANDLGLAVTVGESPASPGARVRRVALKQAAGAGMCILNHAGEPEELIEFAAACAAAGSHLPMIAPIPMAADLEAAAGLIRFPGLRLPARFVELMSGRTDPTEASIALAGQLAQELAASGRFVGVNLSGAASTVDPFARIALTTRFIDAVRDGWAAGVPVGSRSNP